jgi:hypothetical protein
MRRVQEARREVHESTWRLMKRMGRFRKRMEEGSGSASRGSRKHFEAHEAHEEGSGSASRLMKRMGRFRKRVARFTKALRGS